MGAACLQVYLKKPLHEQTAEEFFHEPVQEAIHFIKSWSL